MEGRSPEIGGEFGEEGGSGHDERHMAMPGMPRAGFAMIEAEIALGALETFLDRPAQAGGACEFRQAGSLGREDEIVGLLVGLGEAAPD